MLRRLLVLAILGVVAVRAWPYALQIPEVRETIEGAGGMWRDLTNPPTCAFRRIRPLVPIHCDQ